MARRSAYHAMSHPAYAFPGYECRCGVKSASVGEHDKHVLETHADDPQLIAKVVSAKTWNRWERQGKVPPYNETQK